MKLDEAILREIPRLERFQGLIKVIAGVAPLLGLLGTVVGMIKTFQSITLFGTGDPKLMADGISQALVTTVEGLVVAIPMVFMHALISGKSRALIEVLEEQSAGLIARRAEQEDFGS
jgi:biopolymer transport protein ExbB